MACNEVGLPSAGLLLRVASKGGAIRLTATEKEILGDIDVLGVVILFVAMKIWKSPIVKTTAEAATTTEPIVNLGAG